MKRRDPSDWEEIKDPDSVPRDLEAGPVVTELPGGVVDDENYAWKRPEGGTYMPPTHRMSSEELLNRASQAKTQRSPQQMTDYARQRRRRQFLLRTLVTFALFGVIVILGWAIKGQVDLREEILSGTTPSSKTSAGTTAMGGTTETGLNSTEGGMTAVPSASVSIEIVGSWADRTPTEASTVPTSSASLN